MNKRANNPLINSTCQILNNLNNICTEIFNETTQSLNVEIANAIRFQKNYNAWHTLEAIGKRISNLYQYYQPDILKRIELDYYSKSPKTIGYFSSHNQPLEAFSYLIYCLVTGHCFQWIDHPGSDQLFGKLLEIIKSDFPVLKDYIKIKSKDLVKEDYKLVNIKAQPQSNLDNYYLKNNLISIKSKFSIAQLNGTECEEDLKKLSNLIFCYFGFSTANVKTLIVPQNYDFKPFLDTCEDWYRIRNHNKYCNNYEYHQSVYLMNQIRHLDNGFLLLRENNPDQSPTGTLYYSYDEHFFNTNHEKIRFKYSSESNNDIHSYDEFDSIEILPEPELINLLNVLKNEL